MDTKTIVGAIIAVIMLCTVVVPIVSSGAEQVSTAQNNELGNYSVQPASDANISLSYDSANYYLNNKKIEIKNTDQSSHVLLFSDKFLVESAEPSATPSLRLFINNVNTLVKSINVSGHTISYVVDSDPTEVQLDYSWIVYPSNTGTYTYCKNVADVYVDANSIIYIAGVGSSTGNLPFTYVASGTVNNLNASATVIDSGQAHSVSATCTLNSSGDPIKIAKPATITFTYESQEITRQAYQVFVPIQYHIVTENDKTVQALIYIIPVLLAVSIVVGIAATIYTKRE